MLIYRTGLFLSFLEESVNAAAAIPSNPASGREMTEAQGSRGAGSSPWSEGTKGLPPPPSGDEPQEVRLPRDGPPLNIVTFSESQSNSQLFLPGDTSGQWWGLGVGWGRGKGVKFLENSDLALAVFGIWQD